MSSLSSPLLSSAAPFPDTPFLLNTHAHICTEGELAICVAKLKKETNHIHNFCTLALVEQCVKYIPRFRKQQTEHHIIFVRCRNLVQRVLSVEKCHKFLRKGDVLMSKHTRHYSEIRMLIWLMHMHTDDDSATAAATISKIIRSEPGGEVGPFSTSL